MLLVCFAPLQVFLSALVGKVPGVRVRVVGHTTVIYPG